MKAAGAGRKGGVRTFDWVGQFSCAWATPTSAAASHRAAIAPVRAPQATAAASSLGCVVRVPVLAKPFGMGKGTLGQVPVQGVYLSNKNFLT